MISKIPWELYISYSDTIRWYPRLGFYSFDVSVLHRKAQGKLLRWRGLPHCFIGSVKNSAGEVSCLPHNTSHILNYQGGIDDKEGTDEDQEGRRRNWWWPIERVVMRQFFPKPQLGCFFAAFLCTEGAQIFWKILVDVFIRGNWFEVLASFTGKNGSKTAKKASWNGQN